MEVAGGVAGYLMKEDIHGMLEKHMTAAMKEYNFNNTNTWDVMQYDVSVIFNNITYLFIFVFSPYRIHFS